MLHRACWLEMPPAAWASSASPRCRWPPHCQEMHSSASSTSPLPQSERCEQSWPVAVLLAALSHGAVLGPAKSSIDWMVCSQTTLGLQEGTVLSSQASSMRGVQDMQNCTPQAQVHGTLLQCYGVVTQNSDKATTILTKYLRSMMSSKGQGQQVPTVTNDGFFSSSPTTSSSSLTCFFVASRCPR